jgi:hypothetical protein
MTTPTTTATTATVEAASNTGRFYSTLAYAPGRLLSRERVSSRGDERNAQSEKDHGDTEPDRSPKTKL